MKSDENNGTLSAALVMRIIFATPSILESHFHYNTQEHTHEKQKGLLISSVFDFFSSTAQIYADNKNKHTINQSISIAKFISSVLKVGFAFTAYLLSLNQSQETDKKNKDSIKWLNKAHEVIHWIHHALSLAHLVSHTASLINHNTSSNRAVIFEETQRSIGLGSRK